jgi:hypothetical protein
MATTKPLWHYDPSSKNEAGTAPNGFKIYRATVVDSLRINDDTKQIAAVKFTAVPPGAPNFSRGEGEIIEVLAGKGPVVGDFIEAALPRVTGKQAEPPRTEAASRDDRSPLVLFVSTFFDALRAPRPLAPTRKW